MGTIVLARLKQSKNDEQINIGQHDVVKVILVTHIPCGICQRSMKRTNITNVDVIVSNQKNYGTGDSCFATKELALRRTYNVRQRNAKQIVPKEHV